MTLKYVETKKELPVIGKRVRVRPWKEKVWLTKYDFVEFISGKEYYGRLVNVLTYGGTVLVWDIEEFEKYHFPVEAFTFWVKEIHEPINDRFEILDL
jgi:hypothetical protein